MKILSDKEYRHLVLEREALIEVIDHSLKQFSKLDREQPLWKADNAFYFWDSIGRMMVTLEYCGVEKSDEWIGS